MEKQRKISIVSLLIAILLIVTITIGTSYSLWTTSVHQESVNTIDVGCFRIDFSDEGFTAGGNINITKGYPMTKEKGKALVPYKFSISNTCSVASSYNVLLETLNTSTMDETNLDVYFNDTTIKRYVDNVTEGLSEDAKNGMNLTKGYLAAGETATYNLRVWIDYDVTVDTPDVQGKTWNGRVVVNSEATFTKVSFTNKVIGEENVTLDIDTKNDKTVQTLECYYGNDKVQNEVGTAVGKTQCQYPLTAEYAKYKVTYSDGTTDTSYPKQLVEYIVKDGVEKYNMTSYNSITSNEDGYVKVNLSANGTDNSTYFVSDRVFDLSKYYGMYYDVSYNLNIPANSLAALFAANTDNGDYDGTDTEYILGYPIYSGTNTSAVSQSVERQQYSLVFNANNHFKVEEDGFTPASSEFDLNNFKRSFATFLFNASNASTAELNVYNWFYQLAE